jgi:hypothetical protein
MDPPIQVRAQVHRRIRCHCHSPCDVRYLNDFATAGKIYGELAIDI